MADIALGVRTDHLGVLLSSMSDGTAGMVLGRSAAWVARKRADLDRAPAAPPAAEFREEPAPTAPPFVADFGCGPGVDPEAAMNRPAAPPPQAPTPRPPIALVVAAASQAPRGLQRLRPLTPARLRFARWFDQAGWRMGEIATLFDLDVDELAGALR